MAQLRLIAIALACASCGCRRSDANPASGLTAPAGWRAAPELAKAATTAIADGVVVTGSEAWAEPARGCYAIWMMLHGAAGPIDVAADQLVASVAAQHATVSNVAKPAPADRGVLALAFAKPPYHGQLRAQLASTGDIAAIACLWNEREPASCQTGCTALLGSLR